LVDAFFESVTYRGAFDPSVPMSSQWTAGWTNFDPQDTDYRGTTSAVEERNDDGIQPSAYTLEQNYPNPFNPATQITYQLAAPGRVRLAVYDVMGREVAMLVDGAREAGTYGVTFDANGLASGVYLYRLTANGFTQTMRMMLVR